MPLVHFLFTDFAATLHVEEPFRLPAPHFSGSMLRGILGWALGEVACQRRSEGACRSVCGAPRSCIYGMLYEDPPKNRPSRMILMVPEIGRGDFAQGDFFNFGLRVLGRLGASDESRIRMALERMGEFDFGQSHGRVSVHRARRVGPMNQRPCIPHFDPPPRVATIAFVTPAWLERKEDGKGKKTLLARPSVEQLFDALSWRLRTVCEDFGEYTTTRDQARYASVKEHLKAITLESDLQSLRWNRNAEAHGNTHKMMGVLGEVRLEGELGPLVEYLHLSQYAHVGKSPAFGLGRVQVMFGASGDDPDLRPAGIDA